MAEQNSSKGMMWKTIGVAVVLIAIIYPLTNRTFNSAADAAKGTDESDVRIQPIAKFELAKAEAAAAGAPKIDDKAAWAPRLAQGKDGLIKSVTNGKGAMPPKGGATLSDVEIKGVVDYVLGKVK